MEIFAIGFDGRYTRSMPAKVQFSLKMIFVVTAVVALLAAQAVAFPDWLAEWIGIGAMVLLPSALVAQIVYARGARRAFGIGALTAFLAVVFFMQSIGYVDGIWYSISWCFIIAGGGVAVLVRWLSRA